LAQALAVARLPPGERALVAALGFAVAGVMLLSDVRIVAEPLGYLFAFGNCLLFVLYVVLGHRVAADGGSRGIDRLGAAMLVAAFVALPACFRPAMPAFSNPTLLGAGIGVGVCSSVIPYACDQLAMARLPRATFALLLALLPTTAAVVGFLVLRQVPSEADLGGVGLVVTGVALHRPRT
jgi:inner membrane transporter RhtA